MLNSETRLLSWLQKSTWKHHFHDGNLTLNLETPLIIWRPGTIIVSLETVLGFLNNSLFPSKQWSFQAKTYVSKLKLVLPVNDDVPSS